jgi:hypothetical protein
MITINRDLEFLQTSKSGLLAKYYCCDRMEKEGRGGGQASERINMRTEFWHGNLKERGKVEARIADSAIVSAT